MRGILTVCIIIIVLTSISAGQNFIQEIDSIQVQQSGWTLQQPWTGGFDDSDPALVDIDSDGDLDLFLGQRYGLCWITYFENIGSANIANFQLITRDILQDTLITSIPSYLHSSPTFGDLDGDGDFDMLIGGLYGRIAYAENIGNQIAPFFVLLDTFFSNIDVDEESIPYLVDIDADGDLDLFIGARDLNFINNDGRIIFYRNDGDMYNYNFVFMTNYFDSIDVGSNSAPVFVDIDADADYDLFIGENEGNINFYRNDGTPQLYDFVLVDSMFAGIDLGEYSSVPEFGDIDGDGDYDLLIGQGEIQPDYNDHGGWVYLYENIGDSVNYDFELVCPNMLSFDVGFYCLPSFAELYQEDVYDLIIGRGDGKLFFYKNMGTPDSAFFENDTTLFNNISVTYESDPCFVDIDNDGDQDMFLGREIMMSQTSVLLYLNVGTMGNPEFSLAEEIFPGYTGWALPSLTDIDGDGDYDLFIGKEYGTITFMENRGTPEQYHFVSVTDNYAGIDIGFYAPHLTFCDINADGDADLFIGDGDAHIFYYENIGTPELANFRLITNQYISSDNFDVPTSDTNPAFVDIDNDGDFDFFCGVMDGGMMFYRNLGDSHVPDFHREFGLNDYKLNQNYPNPFNSSTTITFSVPTESPVEIAVFDNLGRKVTTLIEGMQSAGLNTVEWNAEGMSSGVYYISMKGLNIKQSQKVILLK